MKIRVPTELPSKSSGINFDRNQSESVRKHLVLYNGGVVADVYSFNRHGGYFSNQDPSESIGNRRIHTNQIEFHLELIHQLNFYSKIVSELFKIPCCVFVRFVTRIIAAGNLAEVRNGLSGGLRV